MKTIITTLALVFFIGVSYAQKKPAQLPGEDGPSQEDMRRALSSFSIDIEDLVSAPVKLKKFYKGDDGSLIYIRQIDDMVYALAERYDNRFVSVFVGKIEAGKLKTKFYYIPKGQAKGKGSMTFKIELGGMRLVRIDHNSFIKFNFNTMQASRSLPTKLPAGHRAWYRGNSQDNLTGRWSAANVGESHILDLDGDVIAYTRGRRETNHSRPQFASLFIGEKKAGSIEGVYVDLPLGYTYGGGETGFRIVGSHNLRVNKKYFPGVSHKRVLDDKHEVLP